jgi:hypothetical protein
MLDAKEDPAGHFAALEREARRLAAIGQPSDVGQLVLRAVSASIAVVLPQASSEVQSEAAVEALLVLAQTEWSAAANALSMVMLAAQDNGAAEVLLAGGKVVAPSERTS